MGETMRAIVALVVVVAGLGTHVFLTQRDVREPPRRDPAQPRVRRARQRVRAGGGAGAVRARHGVRVLAGPWCATRFPEFDRIKWPAALYTAGFCAFVFLPLAFGAGLWFKAGADAKHPSPFTTASATLNVLGGSCPPIQPVPHELGASERAAARAIRRVGRLLAWVFFTSARRRMRVAALVLIGACRSLRWSRCCAARVRARRDGRARAARQRPRHRLVQQLVDAPRRWRCIPMTRRNTTR